MHTSRKLKTVDKLLGRARYEYEAGSCDLSTLRNQERDLMETKRLLLQVDKCGHACAT
jgi:hypothetical protein